MDPVLEKEFLWHKISNLKGALYGTMQALEFIVKCGLIKEDRRELLVPVLQGHIEKAKEAIAYADLKL